MRCLESAFLVSLVLTVLHERGSKCSSHNANTRTNHQNFSRQHRGAAAFELSGFIFQLFVVPLFKIKHVFQKVFPERPSGQLRNLPISFPHLQ